ncbi:MAG: thiamine pyrophosphate-dependent enzyme [Candidatus Moranbacteria bacterium]|nr:thiamine pyrophosphate-dependent enzyme [Candidatus Moranbacteria bacterium]
MKKNQSKKFTTTGACAGCPIGIVARTVLNATDENIAVTGATGCLEVTTTIYPNTSWKVPYIHSVFANAGATISGMETAYKALKKRGGIDKPVKFIAFGGDGGTYDIGLQALSGALERGHDFLYVCYDNGAYMNTGNQRSGGTPIGADTETTPYGKDSYGKSTKRKDIMSIVAAHHIPYAATANVGFLEDFKHKAKKALETKGPTFLLVFSPCVNQWKYPPHKTIDVAKLATETNFWPLYEIENGEYKINYTPSKKIPVEEFYQTQGRFKHIFKRKDKDEIIKKVQEEVDGEWERIYHLAE